MSEKRGIKLNLQVTANGKQFEIVSFDRENKTLKLKTKAKAQKVRANFELEKELKSIFNENVRIVKGFKSRKKMVFVENLNEEETFEILGKLANS